MGANIKGDGSLNEAAAVGKTITLTGDAAGIAITSAATTLGNYAVQITAASGCMPFRCGTSSSNYIEGAADGNRTFRAYRNLAAATTALPMVQFLQDNDTDDQVALQIQQDAVSTPAVTIQSNTGADILLTPRATASIAAAAEGSIAYDSTLHKLRVRGAAGWETVTSV